MAFLISSFLSLSRSALMAAWKHLHTPELCSVLPFYIPPLARSERVHLRTGELLEHICHAAATDCFAHSHTMLDSFEFLGDAGCGSINWASTVHHTECRECRFCIWPNVKQRKLLYCHNVSPPAKRQERSTEFMCERISVVHNSDTAFVRSFGAHKFPDCVSVLRLQST